MMIFCKKKAKAAYRLWDEYLQVPTVGMFGRLIFGNNAGLYNNLLGLLKCKNTSDNTEVSKLRNHQFLMLSRTERRLSIVSLVSKKAAKAFSAMSTEITKSTGGGMYQSSQLMLVDPIGLIPELKELIDKEILDILRAYYRFGYALKGVRVWRNHGIKINLDGENAFSNQWHCDQFDTSRLKLFFYLSENVDAVHGPTNIFNYSKSQFLLRSFGYLRRGWVFGKSRSILNDSKNHYLVIGGLGDAFFLNATKVLHRAGVPVPGNFRDVVQFEFVGNFSNDFEVDFNLSAKDMFDD